VTICEKSSFELYITIVFSDKKKLLTTLA